MSGNTKKVKLRNEVTLAEVGVTSVEENVHENRLRQFGHIQHNLTDVPARQVKFITVGKLKKSEWAIAENMDGGDT